MLRSLLPFLLVVFCATSAQASVLATRVPEGRTVVVDGRFDEEVWQTAHTVEDFVGTRPTEGFDPAGTTSVRVLYDDEKLYFA